MAAKKRQDQLGKLIAEVEAVAKRLRADIRKRATVLPKDLRTMAARLRKQAARAAAQVEAYVHEIRMELEVRPRRPKKRRAAAR